MRPLRQQALGKAAQVMMSKEAHWTDALTYTLCADALKWLRTQPDAQTAWDKCDRGDWMLYHAGKLAGEPGSDARRPLVFAACACASLALPYVKKGGQRSLAAIEIAERWARGGANAPSLEEVRRAASAAAAYASSSTNTASAASAAYASAAAAHAASAYAASAASAANAANAAFAIDDAIYAARTKTLAQCADIVRYYYTKMPV